MVIEITFVLNASIITSAAKIGQHKQRHATMKGFVIFAKTFYASDNMAVIPHFNSPEINKKAVKEKKH